MSKLSRQDILEAIRRTARENGGVPLGLGRFRKETGITAYDCHKHWPTFGEALREAGFTPNMFGSRHGEEFLLASIIDLMRELGRYPTKPDFIVRRNKDSKFPSPGSLARLGNKRDVATKVSEYAEQKRYKDVVELCKAIIEKSNQEKDSDDFKILALGEVYLFKHGRYYKIGKTNDPVRRGSELRIQLPEKMNLIHSIKTDDPSGVEAYWHRRFERKRMNGEWFDLISSDVKAFKNWKRIV
jgi:hypothetical protein